MRSSNFFHIPEFSDSFTAGNELEDSAQPGLGCAMNRREFVAGAGALTGAAAFGFRLVQSRASSVAQDTSSSGTTLPLELTINGHRYSLKVDPRVTLLDLLREQLGLTGTKKGCDHGQCGACIVIANGRRINSCLSLALVHDGEEVTTVEGLANGDKLHPIQAAFLEYDGFQCGYCTPGQLCSAVALFQEHERADASFVTTDLKASGPIELTPAEIRERMSGNICRCGAYPGIVAAVESVRDEKRRSNG